MVIFSFASILIKLLTGQLFTEIGHDLTQLNSTVEPSPHSQTLWKLQSAPLSCPCPWYSLPSKKGTPGKINGTISISIHVMHHVLQLCFSRTERKTSPRSLVATVPSPPSSNSQKPSSNLASCSSDNLIKPLITQLFTKIGYDATQLNSTDEPSPSWWNTLKASISSPLVSMSVSLPSRSQWHHFHYHPQHSSCFATLFQPDWTQGNSQVLSGDTAITIFVEQPGSNLFLKQLVNHGGI